MKNSHYLLTLSIVLITHSLNAQSMVLQEHKQHTYTPAGRDRTSLLHQYAQSENAQSEIAQLKSKQIRSLCSVVSDTEIFNCYALLFSNKKCSRTSKAKLLEHILDIKEDPSPPRTNLKEEHLKTLLFLWELQGGHSSYMKQGTCQYTSVRLTSSKAFILHHLFFTDVIKKDDRADVLKVLLKAGLDVNGVDLLKRTALHYAVLTADNKSIQVLLDHGAQKDKYDEAPDLQDPDTILSQASKHLFSHSLDVEQLLRTCEKTQRSAYDYALLINNDNNNKEEIEKLVEFTKD